MALKVGELYATLGLDTKDFDKKLGNTDSAMGRLAKVSKTAVKGISGMAAGFAGTALVTGYKRLTSIQDATAAVTVQLGSAKKAGDLMNRVLAVSSGTPFSFDQFASASKQLVAFGVSTEKIPGYLHAIGEAAAATGTGADGLNQIATAFGKMSARGRIYMDDVWQISESGTSALTILANGYGVSTAAMQNMISKGQVPASRAMDLLTAGIMKGSDGAAGKTRALGGTMAALGKTTSGSLANAKAAVARFGATALKPVFDRLPGVLQAGSKELDRFGKIMGPAIANFMNSKGVADVVDRIRDGFSNLAGSPALKNFLGQVVTLGRNVGTLAAAILPPMLRGLAQVAQVAGGVVMASIRGLNGVLGPLSKHGKALVPLIKSLTIGFVGFKGIQAAVGPLGSVAKGIGGVVSTGRGLASIPGVISSMAKTQGVSGLTAAFNVLKTSLAETKIGMVALKVAQMAQAVASKVAAAAQWVWNAAMDANPIGLVIAGIAALAAGFVLAYQKVGWFRDAVDAVGRFFADTLWPILQEVGAWIAGTFTGIVSGIGTVFTTVRDTVSGAVDGIVGFVTSLGGKIQAAVAPLVEIITFPFRTGIDNARSVLTGVVSFASGLPTKIKNAIVGLGSNLLAPFTWGWEHAKTTLDKVVTFVTGLPGKVKTGLVGLGSALLAPFRYLVDNLKRIWNNTIGKIHFSVPDIPGLPGRGKSFSFPRMHTGGLVPGGPNNEPIVQLQGGEVVLSRKQVAALTGRLGFDFGSRMAASFASAGVPVVAGPTGPSPFGQPTAPRQGPAVVIEHVDIHREADAEAAARALEYHLAQAAL